MRPYGRNWRLGLHLPWIPCSGDQGLEIHVPQCPTVDIEARDEILIIFFTRTYDQDLIINGSPVFVRGSQLQENLFRLTSKNDNAIESLESKQELGLQASLGSQNWKPVWIQGCLPFAKSLCVCFSLSECVVSLVGFHFIFLSLHSLPYSASHIVSKSALEMSSSKIHLCPGSKILVDRLWWGPAWVRALLMTLSTMARKVHIKATMDSCSSCKWTSPTPEWGGMQPTWLELRKQPLWERSYHKNGEQLKMKTII